MKEWGAMLLSFSPSIWVAEGLTVTEYRERPAINSSYGWKCTLQWYFTASAADDNWYVTRQHSTLFPWRRLCHITPATNTHTSSFMHEFPLRDGFVMLHQSLGKMRKQRANIFLIIMWIQLISWISQILHSNLYYTKKKLPYRSKFCQSKIL